MVIHKKYELIANTKVMMWTVCDTTELKQSLLLTEMDAVATMVERLVAENKAPVMDQGATRNGHGKASGEISDGQGKRKTYMRFIGGLQKLDGFWGKFDEELWTALLDYAIVHIKDDI